LIVEIKHDVDLRGLIENLCNGMLQK
jgi:hypothetical protein